MIIGTVKITARTYDDFWHAMVEAYSRIEDGNTTGHDHNESGSFEFTITENTEEN